MTFYGFVARQRLRAGYLLFQAKHNRERRSKTQHCRLPPHFRFDARTRDIGCVSGVYFLL